MVPATHCRFDHPGLAGDAVFCLTVGDRVPVLSLALGGSPALLPLPHVARLFGIVPGSADHRMLHLVAASLRFVPALRTGDRLPEEVITGRASWHPEARHRARAEQRMHALLLAWIGEAGQQAGAEPLRRLGNELGLHGADATALIGVATGELACFEALRQRLLVPLRALARQLEQTLHAHPPLPDTARARLREVLMLTQAEAQSAASVLDQVDRAAAGLVPLLRGMQAGAPVLRPLRNRLYADLVAWTPYLADRPLPPQAAPDFWRALGRLHRFLATRAIAPAAPALP